MKKMLLAALAVMLLVSVGFCSFELSWNDATVGTFVNLNPKNYDVLTGVNLDVADLKDLLYLNVGMITSDVQSVVFTTGLSINLMTVMKNAGWDWKLRQGINIGIFMGAGIREGRFTNYYGLYGTTTFTTK